jgi:hypothetical protein
MEFIFSEKPFNFGPPWAVKLARHWLPVRQYRLTHLVSLLSPKAMWIPSTKPKALAKAP